MILLIPMQKHGRYILITQIVDKDQLNILRMNQLLSKLIWQSPYWEDTVVHIIKKYPWLVMFSLVMTSCSLVRAYERVLSVTCRKVSLT